MRKLAGIAQLFCDDVNRTGNGRRTEQANHRHASPPPVRSYWQESVPDRILPTTHTEYGRVYQYLRIRTIQPINTNLLETTILAIGLYTYTGLKFNPCESGTN